METLVQKLKTNSIITLILGLLSLTWIVIDYFVLDSVAVKGLSKYSLEWILLIFSGAVLAVFHISVFVTLYYAFRVIRKAKKGIKLGTKETPAPSEMSDVEQERRNAET